MFREAFPIRRSRGLRSNPLGFFAVRRLDAFRLADYLHNVIAGLLFDLFREGDGPFRLTNPFEPCEELVGRFEELPRCGIAKDAREVFAITRRVIDGGNPVRDDVIAPELRARLGDDGVEQNVPLYRENAEMLPAEQNRQIPLGEVRQK